MGHYSLQLLAGGHVVEPEVAVATTSEGSVAVPVCCHSGAAFLHIREGSEAAVCLEAPEPHGVLGATQDLHAIPVDNDGIHWAGVPLEDSHAGQDLEVPLSDLAVLRGADRPAPVPLVSLPAAEVRLQILSGRLLRWRHGRRRELLRSHRCRRRGSSRDVGSHSRRRLRRGGRSRSDWLRDRRSCSCCRSSCRHCSWSLGLRLIFCLTTAGIILPALLLLLLLLFLLLYLGGCTFEA
mmetsp:Transcript_28607/g.62415  ORF Transcript_28607/g.62415 Transcript_28607/m.62415 type:complete len:237 (+) Transcript_28607:599-1309(+)